MNEDLNNKNQDDEVIIILDENGEPIEVLLDDETLEEPEYIAEETTDNLSENLAAGEVLDEIVLKEYGKEAPAEDLTISLPEVSATEDILNEGAYTEEIIYEEEPEYIDEMIIEEEVPLAEIDEDIKIAERKDKEVIIEPEIEEGMTTIIPNVPEFEEMPAIDTSDINYDGEDEEDEDGNKVGKILNRILIVFGVAVALIAIFMGVSLANKIKGKPEVVDFSEVGVNVAAMGYIGVDKIEEVTQAQTERIDELNVAMDDYDYNEVDESTGVIPINVTLTTILKDLKIKFVNAKNKLIGNVPFQVEVTDSKGKSQIVVDEDKDGIIYLSEISGGSYTVKLIKLETFESLYDFSNTAKQSVNVKSQLDYKKVDVSNEVKNASQVNTATEDTAKKETEVESSLKDTVAYVISSKTAAGNGYEPIDKVNDIVNPQDTLKKIYETAALGRFTKLSGVISKPTDDEAPGGDPEGGENPGGDPEGGENPGGESGGGENPGGESEGGEPQGGAPAAGTTEIVSNNNGTHTVRVTSADGTTENNENCEYTVASNNNGTHDKKCSKCGYTVTESCDFEYTALTNGTHDKKCKTAGCGYTVNETCEYEYISENGTHKQKCKKCNAVTEAVACKDTNNDGKCDVCAADMPKLEASLSFEGRTSYILYLEGATEHKITAKVSVTAGTVDESNIKYSWSLSNGDSIVIDEAVNGKELTISPVKAGNTTITCVASLGNGASVTGMIQVNVIKPEITLNYTGQKIVFIPTTDAEKETYNLKLSATMSDGTNKVTDPSKFVWTSSDTSVATVDNAGIVTGIKDGNAIIKVVYNDGTKVYNEIVKEYKVVVLTQPKNDKTTKLLDKNNKPVFVYDSNSKSYKEATYADYFSGVTLYKQVDITYKYTGWWTIDGKTYYFDANGKKVTGEQVILGAKYSFNNDGVLKSGTGLFGIDVSSWNGNIDWSKVAKSGVSYAIIRCGFRGSTIGGLVSDSKFESNIKGATDAGLGVGVYFFTQAITEAEAVEEASMVLSMISGYKLKYPVFIDVENATNGRANGLSVSARTAIVKAFCKTIENGGYKAGVYANKTWLTNKLNVNELTSYKIWLAQYASAPTYTASRYDMWQYSETGSISGISGNVDLNLYY